MYAKLVSCFLKTLSKLEKERGSRKKNWQTNFM